MQLGHHWLRVDDLDNFIDLCTSGTAQSTQLLESLGMNKESLENLATVLVRDCLMEILSRDFNVKKIGTLATLGNQGYKKVDANHFEVAKARLCALIKAIMSASGTAQSASPSGTAQSQFLPKVQDLKPLLLLVDSAAPFNELGELIDEYGQWKAGNILRESLDYWRSFLFTSTTGSEMFARVKVVGDGGGFFAA